MLSKAIGELSALEAPGQSSTRECSSGCSVGQWLEAEVSQPSGLVSGGVTEVER